MLASVQFQCQNEPKVPDLDDPETKDSALGIYLTRLQSSGQDCRDQLSELKNVLEVQGAVISDVRVIDTKERKRGIWPF